MPMDEFSTALSEARSATLPMSSAMTVIREFFLRQTMYFPNSFISQAQEHLALPLVGLIQNEREKAYIKGYAAARREYSKARKNGNHRNASK